MILFGIKGIKIDPLKLKQGNCPDCKTKNSMWLLGRYNYFHIFWIPMFPLWKKGYALCNHCKGVFEKGELHQHSILFQYFNIHSKQHTKIPWYLFSGIILINIAIFYIITIAI